MFLCPVIFLLTIENMTSVMRVVARTFAVITGHSPSIGQSKYLSIVVLRGDAEVLHAVQRSIQRGLLIIGQFDGRLRVL